MTYQLSDLPILIRTIQIDSILGNENIFITAFDDIWNTFDVDEIMSDYRKYEEFRFVALGIGDEDIITSIIFKANDSEIAYDSGGTYKSFEAIFIITEYFDWMLIRALVEIKLNEI